MGFFDSDTDIDYIPPARVKGTEGTAGRTFLSNLLADVKDFQMPTRQVAGMTDMERAGQSNLADIVAGKAFRDPSTSSYYSGLREASLADEERAASALRNRQTASGMYNSSRAIGEEGRLRGDFATDRATQLGRLYEIESSRDNPYTRLAAATTYGSLPRVLDQAQMDAEYQSMLADIMFPYTTGAGLAQQIVGNEQWYNPTITSQPSDFSNLSSAINLGTSILAPIMSSGLFSGAPSTSGLGSSATPFSYGPIDYNAYWGPGSSGYIPTGF